MGAVYKVKRREALATRRRRAELCRLRQGPDGKWETNRRKEMVRRARNASAKLGAVFETTAAAQAARDAEHLRRAQDLVAEMDAASSAEDLLALESRLGQLVVTASLLRKTMLPKALKEAIDRHPAVTKCLGYLVIKWRWAFKTELQRAAAAKQLPSAAVHAAKQRGQYLGPLPAPPPPCSAASVSTSAQKPRESLQAALVLIDRGSAEICSAQIAPKGGSGEKASSSSSSCSSSGSSSGSSSSSSSSENAAGHSAPHLAAAGHSAAPPNSAGLSVSFKAVPPRKQARITSFF